MTQPMSDERLAEIRREYEGSPTTEVADLLAEVDRARAKLAEIHTTETDVTWLADEVRRIIKGVSVRTAKEPRDAQSIIAGEVASLIRGGILTAFISNRVVGLAVEYVRQAEVERDELKRAARASVLAGHYTARQQFIVDLTRLGVLSPDETQQALCALDGTEAGR